MSFRLLDQRPVYFDAAGNPCAGGTLSSYLTGTLTPTATYADPGLTVSNGSVITLDSIGRTPVDVWATGVLRIIIRDANGVTAFDSDNTQANSEIPSQTGNGGKFLTTDGTSLSWASVSQVPSVVGESGKVLTTDGTTYFWGDPNNSVDGTTISNVVLLNARERCQTVAATAALNIDIRLGAVIKLTQDVDCVATIIGQPAANEAMAFTIVRVKDATGTSRSLSIATAKWPAGVPVPVTQTSGAIDVISCLAFNGEAYVLGSYNTAMA